MPTHTPSYYAHLRERITNLEQSGSRRKAQAFGSLGKSFSLGRKGEPARRRLSEDIQAQQATAQDATSSDDGVLGPSLQQEPTEGNCSRSKSTSTVRTDSAHPIALPALPAAARESYKGYHSLNSGLARKMKLELLEEKYVDGLHRAATMSRAEGSSKSGSLELSVAEPSNDGPAVSPEGDPKPVERQMYAVPAPEDSQAPILPAQYEYVQQGSASPDQHSHTSNRNVEDPPPSPLPRPASSSEGNQPSHPLNHSSSQAWQNEHIHLPSHPYYGMTPEQRQAYWDRLSAYTASTRNMDTQYFAMSSTSGLSRHGEASTPGLQSVVEGQEGDGNAEVAEQNTDQEHARSSASKRLLHNLLCRPGSCSPDCPSSPTASRLPIRTGGTAPATARYKMKSLTKRMRGKQVVEDLQAVESGGGEASAQQAPEAGKMGSLRSRIALSVSRRKPNVAQQGNQEEVSAAVEALRAQSLQGHARVSKTTRCRPTSMPSPPSTTVSAAGPSRSREGSQGTSRPVPSLSDRLRNTHLEDLHGMTPAVQQEIDVVLSEVERGRSDPYSTFPQRSRGPRTSTNGVSNPNAGTIRASIDEPLSETENKCRTRMREVSDRATRQTGWPFGALNSHTGSFTLGKSYRVPANHDAYTRSPSPAQQPPRSTRVTFAVDDQQASDHASSRVDETRAPSPRPSTPKRRFQTHSRSYRVPTGAPETGTRSPQTQAGSIHNIAEPSGPASNNEGFQAHGSPTYVPDNREEQDQILEPPNDSEGFQTSPSQRHMNEYELQRSQTRRGVNDEDESEEEFPMRNKGKQRRIY